MTKIIWHYTNGLVIGDILASGVIKLAQAGVPKSERAAAWFSTNPVWDASANRANMKFAGKGKLASGPTKLNLDDLVESNFDPEVMDKVCGGRFRIGVVAEAAPHSWESFKKLSGIAPEMVRVFETVCEVSTEADPERGKWGRTLPGNQDRGNPREWWASFQPVPRKMWRTCEKRVDGEWAMYVDLTPSSVRLS